MLKIFKVSQRLKDLENENIRLRERLNKIEEASIMRVGINPYSYGTMRDSRPTITALQLIKKLMDRAGLVMDVVPERTSFPAYVVVKEAPKDDDPLAAWPLTDAQKAAPKEGRGKSRKA